MLVEELDGERAAKAEAILEASKSLANTSRKVGQFDWLVEKEGKHVTHDLFPLVKRCIEQLRTTNPDADVSIAIPEETHVRAIRDLDVAIRNLVENALQHTDDGETSHVRVAATTDPETVTLTVTDDGPGIPQTEVDVIKSGQETALDHASGLGLWLVRRVVAESGGELSFTVEDGTTVEVTLPRADVGE